MIRCRGSVGCTATCWVRLTAPATVARIPTPTAILGAEAHVVGVTTAVFSHRDLLGGSL